MWGKGARVFYYLLYFNVSISAMKYLNMDLLDFGFWMDPEFGKINVSKIHRMDVGDGYLTNVFDGELDLYHELSCDAVLMGRWALFVKNEYKTTFVHNLTLYQLLYGYGGAINASIQHFRNCISPLMSCPTSPGLYVAKNCYMQTTYSTSLIISKRGNLSVVVITPDEKVIGSDWVVGELDDTVQSKTRKPTASQRNRRKKFGHSKSS